MSRGGISGVPLQRGAPNVQPDAPRSVQEWLASKKGGAPASGSKVAFPPTASHAAVAPRAALFKRTANGKPKHRVDVGAVFGFDANGPEERDSLSTHMTQMASVKMTQMEPTAAVTVNSSGRRPRLDTGAVWGFDGNAAAQPPMPAAARDRHGAGTLGTMSAVGIGANADARAPLVENRVAAPPGAFGSGKGASFTQPTRGPSPGMLMTPSVAACAPVPLVKPMHAGPASGRLAPGPAAHPMNGGGQLGYQFFSLNIR